MVLNDFLGKMVHVTVDRPLGSRHPQHGFLYLLNYGYVPGTIAPDGDEVDAYVLGVFEPLTEFEGQCVAIIHRLDDEDDKLVLVAEGKQYTDEQILALTEFQERYFMPIVMRASHVTSIGQANLAENSKGGECGQSDA
jgi:inorganic pyrophosphatase